MSRIESIFSRLGDAAYALAGRNGNRRPPHYGQMAGTWLAGQGYAPPATQRDYEREVGRVDLNGVVRLCLRWYANAITEATFKVGRKVKRGERKGEWQESASHPLPAILARPCPVFSARETWAMVAAGFLIDGNAYLVVVRDNAGRPAELWWVPNHQVEIVAGDDPARPISHYRVDSHSHGSFDYAPDDVVHIKDLPDTENPLVGQGVLKAFLSDILGHKRGAEYTESVLRRCNAGILLMPPSGGSGGMSYAYTPAEEDEMRGHAARIRRGLDRGAESNVMFSTAPLAVEKIGFSPEEMALDRILDRPEAYIASAMGLSPLLLDLPSSRDSKTYANKAEARKGAWEDSVIPMLGVIAGAVRDQVLYRPGAFRDEPIGQFGDAPGLEVWADTSEVPALQENKQEVADYWVGLVDAGLCTPEYAASQLDIPEEAVPEEQEDFEPTPEELAAVEAGDEGDDGDAGDGDDEDDDAPDDDANDVDDEFLDEMGAG